jgi:transcriptional regulator with XRE-family HTH domain
LGSPIVRDLPNRRIQKKYIHAISRVVKALGKRYIVVVTKGLHIEEGRAMARMPTTGLIPIGDVVRAWRQFRGFSSTKLADRAGVRLSYLSEIEHNRTINPKEEYLEKLALALEVPLEDIYGRRMPPLEGEAGDTSGSEQDRGDEGNKKGGSQSTVLHAPVALKRQKILMHRLGVAEKRVLAAGEMLNELYTELCEIAALVADMSSGDTKSEKENHIAPSSNGSV